jgi:LysM repeat protein
MNSPSPLIPQGSNLEQQNKVRSSLKVKIFCAIGVNVAVLLVLLMQGCKREQPVVETVTTESAPIYDASNQPPQYADPVQPDTGTSNTTYVPPEPPPQVPPQIPAPVTGNTEYKVAAGDTFYTIGKKFGVTDKAIQAANPTVDPKKLQIGKPLQIPAPTAAAPVNSGAAAVVEAVSGAMTYTVKSGDNLSKIATQFHTTVPALKAANGLTTDRIKVGDKLKIPAKSTP